MDKIKLKKVLERIVNECDSRAVDLAEEALEILNVKDSPPPPLEDRQWTIYREDKTTSVIKLHKDGTVAVARAYLSQNDNFCRKTGRSIAESRMKALKPEYEDKTEVHHLSIDLQKYAETHSHEPRYKPHAIFEIVKPEKLHEE